MRVLHTIGRNKYYRANWKALVLKFHDAWKAHQNCILLNHNSKFIWGNKVELNLDEKNWGCFRFIHRKQRIYKGNRGRRFNPINMVG